MSTLEAKVPVTKSNLKMRIKVCHLRKILCCDLKMITLCLMLLICVNQYVM